MRRGDFIWSVVAAVCAPILGIVGAEKSPVAAETSGLAQVGAEAAQSWSVTTATSTTGTVWYIVGADGRMTRLGDTQWTHNL